METTQDALRYNYYSGGSLVDDDGYLLHRQVLEWLHDALQIQYRQEDCRMAIESRVSKGQVDVLIKPRKGCSGPSVAFEIKTFRPHVEQSRIESQVERYAESVDSVVWVIQAPDTAPTEASGLSHEWYHHSGRPVYHLHPSPRLATLWGYGDAPKTVADLLAGELYTDMARNQRVNFSLPPDVVDLLEQQEPRGDRSEAVANAIREYYDE